MMTVLALEIIDREATPHQHDINAVRDFLPLLQQDS